MEVTSIVPTKTKVIKVVTKTIFTCTGKRRRMQVKKTSVINWVNSTNEDLILEGGF